VNETVRLHNYWERLGPDGTLAASDDWDVSARLMFDRLSWWAGVLRRARAARGYHVPRVNRQERNAPRTASGSVATNDDLAAVLEAVVEPGTVFL
jgi:hypothetical protein